MRSPYRTPGDVVMLASYSTGRDSHPGDDRLAFAHPSHPNEMDIGCAGTMPGIRPGNPPIPAHMDNLQSPLELSVEPDAQGGTVVVTASLHLGAALPAMTVVLGADATLDLALRLIAGVTRLRKLGGAS
jgi:hypothetical protein